MLRFILLIVLLSQGLWESSVAKAYAPNVNTPNRLGVVISILQDVSSSYENPPMTPEQIEVVAKALAESGRGGVIGYELIGRRSVRHFVRLELNVLPMLTVDNTLSEKVIIQQKRNLVQSKNQKAILEFVSRVRQLLKTHQKETATDIANAFERSCTFLNEPQHRSMTRILVINSDGISNTTVTYTVPTAVRVYLIGWKAANRPSAESFESPQGFVQFMKINFDKR